MARTLTKAEPVKKTFLKGLITAISSTPEQLDYDDDIWNEPPATLENFCDHYLNESLYPEQLKFCNELLNGDNPTAFDSTYEEGIAFFGKGAGKDRTIAKLLLWQAHRLRCLKNPQWFLREICDCSIGDGDAIDMANMSINARQSRNVFFKKLKGLAKTCKNPKTGKNWFVERGVDLRDGYDIQNDEIRFGYNITAHCLNSETNTGEGLNLFFAVIDEFGSFPAEKVFALRDAIDDTIRSRFKRVGKLVEMSYRYSYACPMTVLYKTYRHDKDVLTSKKTTFEVNPKLTKQDFAKKYRTNPEKAKMVYECKGIIKGGGYISKPYMLEKMFDANYENPIKGNLLSIKSDSLRSLKFKDWFKGIVGKVYAVRVDLGTGRIQSGNDSAGLALIHCEKMLSVIDPRLKVELAKEGIMVENVGENTTRKGFIIDLAIQINSGNKSSEIQLSDIREFILMLKDVYKFNIVFCSYDGFQSKDSIQILNNQGIVTELLSVDRDNEAYDTTKELMYQQLVKTYPHDIAEREFRELIINEKGKVSHPDKSWSRLQLEGVDFGSKDVTDAIVGGIKNAFDKINLEPDIFFF